MYRKIVTGGYFTLLHGFSCPGTKLAISDRSSDSREIPAVHELQGLQEALVGASKGLKPGNSVVRPNQPAGMGSP